MIYQPTSGSGDLDRLALHRFLAYYHSTYNIQVMRLSQPLYVLNLEVCFAVIGKISKNSFTVNELFGKEPPLRERPDWLSCFHGPHDSSAEIV